MTNNNSIYIVTSLDWLLNTLWTVKKPIEYKGNDVKYAECLYKHGKTADSKYGNTTPKFATLQEAKEFFVSFATYEFVVEQKPINNVKFTYEIIIHDGTNGILMKFFTITKLW